MPQPSHYQDYRLIGAVKDVIIKHGRLTWIIVEIDQGEPCLLPVAPGAFTVPADLGRHDLVHVRGELRMERSHGSRHGLPFVLATRVLERLRRRPPTASAATANAEEPQP
jgi:hypothetical protein